MSCSELLSPGMSLLDVLSGAASDGDFLDHSNQPLTDAQLEDLLRILQEQAQQQQGLQLHHELPAAKQQMAHMSASGPLASNSPPVCSVQQNLSDAEFAIDAEICQLLALKQQTRQKQRRHSQNMALHQLAARLQATGPTSSLLHDLHNTLHMQDVASQMALLQEQSVTVSEQPWGATAAFSPDTVMSSAASAATAAAAVSRPGTGSRASIDMGSYQQNVEVSPFTAGAADLSGPLQQCSMALAAAAYALSMPLGRAMTPDHSPFASAGAPVQVELGLDLTAVLSGLNMQDTNMLLSPPQSFGNCVLTSAALSSFDGALSPAQSVMQGLQGTCSSSGALLMPAAASSFDFAPAGAPASAQAYCKTHTNDVLHRASGALDRTMLDTAGGSARGLYSPKGHMQAVDRARARRHSLQLPGSYTTSAQHATGAGAMLGGVGPAAWVQEGQPGNTEQQDAALGPACRPFWTGLPPAQAGLLPIQTVSKNRRHSVHLAGVGCMPAPHSSGMSAQWRSGSAAQEAYAGHAGLQGVQVSTASSRACRTLLEVPAAANTASAAAAAASGVFQASTRQPGGVSRQSLDVRPNAADRNGRQSLDARGNGTARRSVDLPAKSAAPKWADATWHPKAVAAAAAANGAGRQHIKGTGVFMPRMAA